MFEEIDEHFEHPALQRDRFARTAQSDAFGIEFAVCKPVEHTEYSPPAFPAAPADRGVRDVME
jgi:hypothetical protein